MKKLILRNPSGTMATIDKAGTMKIFVDGKEKDEWSLFFLLNKYVDVARGLYYNFNAVKERFSNNYPCDGCGGYNSIVYSENLFDDAIDYMLGSEISVYVTGRGEVISRICFYNLYDDKIIHLFESNQYVLVDDLPEAMHLPKTRKIYIPD